MSRETAYRLLSKSRRRHLLTLLFELEEESLETLGRKIAARETDESPSDVPERTYTRVVTALIHCHIPYLADYGLVDYDRETRTVTLETAARERFPFQTTEEQFFTSLAD
ncbi:hypothetical protein HALLA_16955 [Halostagnicola larsenii XH-48]|uniref:DUF7344 domain-containing protein n=1 Tax=Halostagnicola larsenii XH-48 TaxID=797299 RepID=W0JT85_9EURY|nr:hypothetical protein HALLA_16955 [Halostagnicola larsenii XH-48]